MTIVRPAKPAVRLPELEKNGEGGQQNAVVSNQVAGKRWASTQSSEVMHLRFRCDETRASARHQKRRGAKGANQAWGGGCTHAKCGIEHAAISNVHRATASVRNGQTTASLVVIEKEEIDHDQLLFFFLDLPSDRRGRGVSKQYIERAGGSYSV